MGVNSEQLSLPAILQSISVRSANAGTLQLGIYQDNGSNYPGNLLVQTGPMSVVAGWNTLPIPNTVVSPGTYWLAYSGCSASNPATIYYDVPGTSYGTFTCAMQDPFPSSSVIAGSVRFCMHANYCLGPGVLTYTPTGTFTQTPTWTLTPTPTGLNTPPPTDTPLCGSPNQYGNSASFTYYNYPFSLSFTRMVASGPGTVMNLNAYVLYPNNGYLQSGLYADNAGQPSTLLAASVPMTVTSAGWWSMDIPDTPISGPATYWIAIQCSNARYVGITYDSFHNSNDQFQSTSNPFGSMPASVPALAATNLNWSVFAKVCQAASVPIDTPTITISPTPTPVPCGYPGLTCTPTWTYTPCPYPGCWVTCIASMTLTPTSTPTGTLSPSPTPCACTPTPTIAPCYGFISGSC